MKKICLLIILTLCVGGCAFVKSRLLERSNETVTVGTYQAEVLIDRPQEEVFEFLSNWGNMRRIMDYATFDPIAEDEIDSAGPYVNAVVHMFGLHIPLRYIIIEHDPPRRITVAQARGARGWMIMDLEPVEQGTLLRVSLHVFLVPDSPSSRLYISMAVDGFFLERFVKEAMTEKILQLKEAVEGKDADPGSLVNESYKVFVDAYFMVEEDFAADPEEMFETLATPQGLNRLLAGRMEFEPRGGSGGLEVGDLLAVSVDLGAGAALDYDAVVLQCDRPEEFRMVLLSPDVIMELDFLVLPTLTGSRVISLVMVNFTESEAEQTFETLMHTSEIDRWVGDGLARIKEEMEGD
jgi:uncharacterized protein YndB with AHSA1/START domain